MTLAAAISAACGCDRLERLLHVGHQHLPILTFPLAGPKLQLLDSMLSDPRAIRGIDPASGTTGTNRAHLDVKRMASRHRVDGAARVHRDAALQSPPPACAQESWDELRLITLAANSDEAVVPHSVGNVQLHLPHLGCRHPRVSALPASSVGW